MDLSHLSKVTQEATNAALALIEERYGSSVSGENALAFHQEAHTLGVVDRAIKLAQAMDVSPEDADLAGIAAAFHDTVQRWEETQRADGAVLRKRFMGKNEEASAAEAVRFLQETGRSSDRSNQLVTEAILATVPGWSIEHSTVVQPNLRPDSHPVVRAVALADLGTGGMLGKAFVHEGDPLFREEQLDIARALRAASKRSDIDPDTQAKFRARMIAWTQSQSKFTVGRKALLEAELGNLSDTAKQRVRDLFCGFDQAIEASAALAAEREKLSFWEIAEAMGYSIPSA